MKLGIFGGSFDPVHLGHLILAERCREQAKLDRVLFVPAARPPHKQDQTQTPFHHRVEMLTLAISGNPAFQVDELENERTGPSYTVDTLETLRARGQTMVIVEQSINIALAISDRAIFLEKGAIRFEGPTRELAERDDLARAVFLGREGG